MATAQDIINQAVRRINVLAGQEALDAAEMFDNLGTFNNLLFNFPAMGIQYVHQTLTQTTVVNFPDQQLRNVMLMLADELADEYGMTLGVKIASDIQAAKLALQAAYLVVDPAVPDKGLRNRRWGWYNVGGPW